MWAVKIFKQDKWTIKKFKVKTLSSPEAVVRSSSNDQLLRKY